MKCTCRTEKRLINSDGAEATYIVKRVPNKDCPYPHRSLVFMAPPRTPAPVADDGAGRPITFTDDGVTRWEPLGWVDQSWLKETP